MSGGIGFPNLLEGGSNLVEASTLSSSTAAPQVETCPKHGTTQMQDVVGGLLECKCGFHSNVEFLT